jgi:flagellar assembly factor FliW
VKVITTRFGELEVQENEFFKIPEGILGFENLKNFFFIDPNDQTLILWLQSKEEAALAFPVIEPKIFNPDYSLKLLPSELESLELKDLSDASVYCILTIPKQVTEMSANLKAPLIINNKTKKGRQIVLQDNKLEVRFPIYNELKKYIVGYTSTQDKKTMPAVMPKNRISKEKESNV